MTMTTTEGDARGRGCGMKGLGLVDETQMWRAACENGCDKKEWMSNVVAGFLLVEQGDKD